METESSNFRNEIRDEQALVALEIAKLEGVQIEYQDRATDRTVSLWAIPGNQSRVLTDDGQLNEEETQAIFSVPRQMGCTCGALDCYLVGENGHNEVILFPPQNGPSTQAKITWENLDWAVKDWQADSVQAVYALRALRHQARRTSRI